MIYAVLLLIVAIVSAGWALAVLDYRGRTHSGAQLLAFAAGFLMGPLGVALVWMVPPDMVVLWSRRAEWERHSAFDAGWYSRDA